MQVYDPKSDLLHGPKRERSCTDIPCCLLFLAFLTAMVVIGIIGFATGDPGLVIYPYDSSGNQCGRPDTATSDYDYLYYVTPSDSLDYRVCLKSCPKKGDDDIKGYSNDFVKVKSDGFTVFEDGDAASPSATELIPSTSFLKRFCLPDSDATDNLDSEYQAVLDAVRYAGTTEWVRDVAVSYSVCFVVFAVAVVISIVYLVLVRYCVGCMLWSTIVISIVGLIWFGIYLYLTAVNDYDSKEDEDTQDALKITSYIVFGLTVIFIIIVFAMCSRIRKAIAVMKSAAIFLSNVKSSLFIPIIMFCVTLGIFAFWVGALVCLYASGTLVEGNNTFAKMEWTDATRNAFYFELIGILWVNTFKVSIVQFTIAFCVCTWYFSPDKDDMKSPLCRSYFTAFRYHLGSLAFGSLIIAIVQLIAWFFRFLKNKLYKNSDSANIVTRCMCGCVSCLITCFEKCIEFLGKHAYIQIAMTGESFCKAAKNSFLLIIENAGNFAVTGSVGMIFTFLGKVLITMLSSYVGYVLLTKWDYIADQIENPIAPTIVFVIISYIVASIFINVFDMAIDSIIHAYLLDERNQTQHHDYAPEPLKQFMEEHR